MLPKKCHTADIHAGGVALTERRERNSGLMWADLRAHAGRSVRGGQALVWCSWRKLARWPRLGLGCAVTSLVFTNSTPLASILWKA